MVVDTITMSDLDKPMENILITSSFGNIELPTNELYNFINTCMIKKQENDNKIYTEMKNFFDDSRYETQFHAISPHEAGAMLKCLFSVLERDYKIIRTTDFHYKNQVEIPASYHEFDFGHERDSLMVKGYVFAEHPQWGKVIMHLSPFSDDFNIELEVFFNPQTTSFKKIWGDVENYFITEGPLLRNKIDAKWKPINVSKRDWESIVVRDDNKRLIDRHIVSFIEHIGEYKKRRLPTSRGVLITGPPGTGKTLCCETIMNVVDCTAIYVTSDTIEHTGQIKEIYDLARKLSPTLVVIEDIDTLGGLDRREKGNHPLLGEFLNCLSGVGGNDGVITIATTNYPENLDIALADRPGRFDLRIEFGLPDAHLRKYILEKYLEEVESKNIDLKRIIKGTEGMSGAYLREVIMVSYMISIERKSVVTQDILNEALNTVRELKNNISVSYGVRKPLEDIYS